MTWEPIATARDAIKVLIEEVTAKRDAARQSQIRERGYEGGGEPFYEGQVSAFTMVLGLLDAHGWQPIDTMKWYPCACGAEHDTPTCPFELQSTGALSIVALWTLLDEADDHKATWSPSAWSQWFVRLVDAVAALSHAERQRAEYDSGAEDCAICHKATQNGVWGCDLCWDEIQLVCGEYLRLRQRAAFDQAHGLRPVEEPPSTNAVDPVGGEGQKDATRA